MAISFTTQAEDQLKEIKEKSPRLFRQIQKQLRLFALDPKYPSLRTHKLEGNLQNSWSVSVQGNIRMLYTIEEGEIIFFIIGTHDEVYKKK